MLASLTPPTWMDRALCAQSGADAWFPERGERPAMARRVCGACPVRAECLDYALSGADTWNGIASGIWGGTTAHERDELRRARRVAA